MDNGNELYHHGVLGMRWGHRKSTTSSSGSSKKRLNPDKEIKKERKNTLAVRRHLSDGDLKKAVERLQQEKKLKELTKEDVAPGRTKAAKILGQIGKTAVTAAGTAVATYGFKAAMEGKFDIKEAAKFIKPKK